MAEEMKNVNNANENEVKDQQNNQQDQQAQKPEKEIVTWKFGPVSIDLNPKVAKVLKGVGIGIGAIGAVALGSKIGSGSRGKKDGAVIDGQAAEISRLNALLETAENAATAIPETIEAVADVVPDVAEEIVE